MPTYHPMLSANNVNCKKTQQLQQFLFSINFWSAYPCKYSSANNKVEQRRHHRIFPLWWYIFMEENFYTYFFFFAFFNLKWMVAAITNIRCRFCRHCCLQYCSASILFQFQRALENFLAITWLPSLSLHPYLKSYYFPSRFCCYWIFFSLSIFPTISVTHLWMVYNIFVSSHAWCMAMYLGKLFVNVCIVRLTIDNWEINAAQIAY